ncbi:GDSL esterase/lipase At4g01130 [Selaginella moellendorffii]|uniref:GDSL esterase/lipase At4g01130 n=1 Tax=Selaginella moellendorffii TaxID=88036 RepID=UPI000D1C3CA6|nr:GDSL esterase/lipase At4g01130 [Selaginella moellendorffii]|eukprot:XP_024525422.1 GDSL esterase/lipase At4g01130 [Selaginella moellendorffii]
MEVFLVILAASIVSSTARAFSSSPRSPPLQHCPSAVFWFGDSFADTGNAQAASPFISAAEYLPYGMTHFGKPSNRYSDGRLVTDFFAQAFRHKSSPGPILQSLNSNYEHGIVFAVSGATALNTSYVVPFYLPVQVDQYLRFVKDAYGKPHHHHDRKTKLPRKLRSVLHVVVVGTNDIFGAYIRKLMDPGNVTVVIVPQVVQAISHAIQTLSDSGASQILVLNSFPHGCMPLILSVFGDLPKDSRGCLSPLNEVAEAFNRSLYKLVQDLSSKLKNTLLLYADAFKFTLDVMDRPTDFGFRNETKTSACCGTGGAYNFNSTKLCGKDFQPESTTLKPSEFVSWDGIHFTEAFYEHLSKALLTGKYLDPPLDFSEVCKLGNV